MCGIAGIVDWTGKGDPDQRRRDVEAMTRRLAHRGPDGEGVWSEPGGLATFGHRRLAIIDLSEAGAQPMISADGDLVLTYNGEIYNYRDLADDLHSEGVILRGGSDTEVLLEAIVHWGLDTALDRAVGMFAFALWSRSRREVVLVRDRLGKKPLYWTTAGGRLAFASELTGLLTLDTTPRDIDRDALTLYMRHACVPAPRTILQGVQKLEAGTMLVFRTHDQVDEHRYWSVRAIATAGADNPFAGTYDEALDELDRLIDTAVKERMIADVPLGAFVSGGIDSSLIVAKMAQASGQRIRTFTIAFDDGPWDESPHARAVCDHLETEHTELALPASAVLDHVDQVAAQFDEPFADASMIPTYLICRLAREHVTVALAGDGGDELFAGYSRYPWVLDADRRFRCWPATMRRMAGSMLGHASLGGTLGTKVHHYAGLIGAQDTDDLYRRVVSAWRNPREAVIDGREPCGLVWDSTLALDVPDPLARMQTMDAATFLPDDILTKVDRASMAVSLEMRAPLLDHRLAAFAFRLPRQMLMQNGRGKLPLRTLLARHVPSALTDRPKQGFAPPAAGWLRGPLKDWADALFAPRRLAEAGLLKPDVVQRLWRQHLSEGWNHTNALWAVAMFERWCEANLGGTPAAQADVAVDSGTIARAAL